MVDQITQQPVVSRVNAYPASKLGQASAPADAGGTGSTASQAALPNPSFQFDAAAGVVVIQFRSAGGKVEVSIPSQQQINAYADQTSGTQQTSGNAVVA